MENSSVWSPVPQYCKNWHALAVEPNCPSTRIQVLITNADSGLEIPDHAEVHRRHNFRLFQGHYVVFRQTGISLKSTAVTVVSWPDKRLYKGSAGSHWPARDHGHFVVRKANQNARWIFAKHLQKPFWDCRAIFTIA